MPDIWLEIYILLTMAIVIFACSIFILLFGYKRGTDNIILWTAFPLVRGLHWLVEALANYNEEILDREMMIFNQLELITAFASSFILLAACLEHNGMIRKPFGKLAILLIAIYPFYLLFTINEDTLEEIEDVVLFRWGEIQTDIFRFQYGFLLPLTAIIILIGVFLYYYYHTRKGHINFNPKVMRSTIVICVLIFVFSIFEGFDYYEDSDIEIIFIGLRGISLAFFIIIPLIVILSQDLGLQKFFLIEPSGNLVFAYNFRISLAIPVEDNLSSLTSGFVAAIMDFSKTLLGKESGVLSVQLGYLYYTIFKTKSKLYAIQSILTNRHLKNSFINTMEKLDVLTSTIHQSTDVALDQVKQILDTNFSIFL